jgi:hypothetical protein
MMSDYDLSSLYEQYPIIIAQMDEVFTSHEFTLRLAQQNQAAYVGALYHYRDTIQRGATVPFMVVHGILAKRLGTHSDLIANEGHVNSTNIFGEPDECSQWRKVK